MASCRHALRAAMALGVALAAVGCGSAIAGAESGPPEDGGTGQDSGAPESQSPADAATGDVGTPPLTCSPGDVSHFVPAWHPPIGPYTGACTSTQYDSLFQVCFGPSASQTDCTKWIMDTNNYGCLSCWATPVTAQLWAPFLYALNPGESDYVNKAGCVALTDPNAVSCAQAMEAEFSCDLAACLTDCPIPKDPSSPLRMDALNALYECLYQMNTGADSTVCGAFSAQATQCAGSLPPSTDYCFTIDTDPAALRRYFELACGSPPPPMDAGSPDGARLDSGLPPDTGSPD